MDVAVLGDLRISHRGSLVRIGGVKVRALLCLLLTRRGEVVPADRLADELWSGRPPASAIGSLQAYVSRLRSVLRPEDVQIQTSRPGYVLVVRPGVLDVNRFEALLRRGVELERSGEHAACAGTLRQALSLWRGAAFGEFTDAPFVHAEVARLEELRLQAFQSRVQADLACGRCVDVVGDVQEELQHNPLREPLWALLMRALVAADRRADALQVYREARTRLREDLGLEPGRELRAAQDLALRPTAGPPGPGTATGTGTVPPGPRTPVAIEQSRHRRLPPQVRFRVAAAPMIGREDALAQLHRAWSTQSGTRAVLVTGDAGIGKSRLAQEFAAQVDSEGSAVLWGSTTPDASVPYEAVIAALRDHVDRQPVRERPVPEGVGGELLARLVPELPPAIVLDTPQPAAFRRYLFFEAVADVLLRADSGFRSLLVLDDVHWADQSTAALVTHLARHPRAERLLVLLLRRRGAGDQLDPGGVLLGKLEDEQLLHRLALGELTSAQAHVLMSCTASAPVPVEVATAVHEGAGGNPFLLLLAAGHLPDGQWSDPPGRDAVADLLHDVANRRLADLGEGTREVLSAAAVVGQRFEEDVVAAVLARDVDRVRLELRAARAAGLLRRDGPAPSWWEFSHALIREFLYGAVPPDRRSSWHRRTGAHLERRPVGELPLEQLVHHLRSAAAADADRAVRYAAMAGDRALDLLAFSEAAGHYESALQMLPLLLEPQDLRRCRLLLALGGAHLAEYEPEALRETFRSAASLALRLGAPGELRRAVVGLVEGTEFGTVDDEAARLLQEAVEESGPGGEPDAPPALRAILCAALARVLPDDDARVVELTREATTLVHRVEDDAARSFVLLTVLLVEWGGMSPSARRVMADEVVSAAEACGAAERAIEARNLRAAVGDQIGDAEVVAADLIVLERFAQQSGRLFFRGLASMRRAGAALACGQYVEAVAASADLNVAAGRSRNFQAAQLVQAFALHRDLGTLHEVRDQVTATATATASSAWRVVDALVHLELGDPGGARDRVEEVLAHGLEAVPRDWLWLPTMGYLAEVCAALGLAGPCQDLVERLAPHIEDTVVVAHGVFSTGAAGRNVALLLAATGAVDAASATFARAAELNRDRELWPSLVRTDLAHAELLDQLPGGSARAAVLRESALEVARRIGMTAVEGVTENASGLARSIDLTGDRVERTTP